MIPCSVNWAIARLEASNSTGNVTSWKMTASMSLVAVDAPSAFDDALELYRNRRRRAGIGYEDRNAQRAETLAAEDISRRRRRLMLSRERTLFG